MPAERETPAATGPRREPLREVRAASRGAGKPRTGGSIPQVQPAGTAVLLAKADFPVPLKKEAYQVRKSM